MSIATLSKFTVPLATDQSASAQGMLMPKLKNRFRIFFENFGVSGSTTELTKQVAEAGRPEVSYEKKTIDIYNSKVNYTGKYTWSELSIKIRDDVTGSVSKLIGEQNQKQFDFFEQSSAASGGDYKFTMRIEMLDGGNGAHTPNVLETWECYGCFITKTTYDSLQYSTADPVMITLSIQPDNCVQVGASAGFGTPNSPRSATTSIVGS
jgi:hypothetical protein